MNGPAWIALGAAILIGIQTGMKIREHLTDYPIRKPKEDQDDPEGN
jgi:hypothetical protein